MRRDMLLIGEWMKEWKKLVQKSQMINFYVCRLLERLSESPVVVENIDKRVVLGHLI